MPPAKTLRPPYIVIPAQAGIQAAPRQSGVTTQRTESP